jgi:hypothetical protein
MRANILLHFLSLIITGIFMTGFFVMCIVSQIKKRSYQRNIWLVAGSVSLVVCGFIFINVTLKVLEKSRHAVAAFTEVKPARRDTSRQVRLLMSYEQARYKGKIPRNYYHYFGFRDWWRFPLVYPYAINCVDVLDRGCIANEEDKKKDEDFPKGGGVNCIFFDFTEFIFDNKYFIGKLEKPPLYESVERIVEGSRYTLNGKFLYKNDGKKNERVDEKKYAKIYTQLQKEKAVLDRSTHILLNFHSGEKSYLTPESLPEKLNEIHFKGSRSFITIQEYESKF